MTVRCQRPAPATHSTPVYVDGTFPPGCRTAPGSSTPRSNAARSRPATAGQIFLQPFPSGTAPPRDERPAGLPQRQPHRRRPHVRHRRVRCRLTRVAAVDRGRHRAAHRPTSATTACRASPGCPTAAPSSIRTSSMDPTSCGGWRATAATSASSSATAPSGWPAVSPDGNTLAFVGSARRQRRHLAQRHRRHVAGAARAGRGRPRA